MTRCERCESDAVCWVGHTKYVRHEYVFGSQDVQQCLDCSLSWRYARSGRRIAVREYRVWGRSSLLR